MLCCLYLFEKIYKMRYSVKAVQHPLTFAGPSLIFFICSLYFISSASNLAIFLSTDSAREST